MTVYRGYVGGYFGTFLSLDALRAWAIVCRDRRGCKGMTLKIMQGTRYGTVDHYGSYCPTKEIAL